MSLQDVGTSPGQVMTGRLESTTPTVASQLVERPEALVTVSVMVQLLQQPLSRVSVGLATVSSLRDAPPHGVQVPLG